MDVHRMRSQSPHTVRESSVSRSNSAHSSLLTQQQTNQIGQSNQAQSKVVPPLVHEVLQSPGQPLDAATQRLFELGFRSPPASGAYPPITPVSPSSGTTASPSIAHPLTLGAPDAVAEQQADQIAAQWLQPEGHPVRTHSPLNLATVRVHTGHQADRSAQQINALAYTAGHHIVFAAGQYAPETPAGQKLLAHELAHVAQANSTVVRRQSRGTGTAPRRTTPPQPAPPRQDYVFIMGSDPRRTSNPFYRVAERYYRVHVPNAIFRTDIRHLAGLLSWIATNVHQPIGNLYIVSHANEDGTLSFGLNAADRDGHLTVMELRDALHPHGGGRSTLDNVTAQIDARTRIHIKGCDLGRTQAMVELIDEAFGGAGTVTAPTHEQGYGTDPTLEQEAREQFRAEVEANHPLPPVVDPTLRGQARTEATRQRQSALRQRQQEIQAELRRRRSEQEQRVTTAGTYENLSGPMFQRPGTQLYTADELTPEVDRLYSHLSEAQRRRIVQRLVAPDRRPAARAQQQGTFQQQGQRVDRKILYRFRFSESQRDQVPADAELIREGRAYISNPERYAWSVEEQHGRRGQVTRLVVAKRVIAYLHHGSLDASAHQHFTRPISDRRFYTTSRFTPPRNP